MSQAEVLVMKGEDRDFVSSLTENPYLLYESTRLSENPVSINAVDRGLLPASSVGTKFPLLGPSRVDTPIDARRLRALSIRELETAVDRGDTLVPRQNIIECLRQRENLSDDGPTMVTGDHLKVAEDTVFASEVRLAHMADGAPAYQLERLAAVGDLIRKTINGRAGGKRHAILFDWRGVIDEILKDHPTDPYRSERGGASARREGGRPRRNRQRQDQRTCRISGNGQDNSPVSVMQASANKEGWSSAAGSYRKSTRFNWRERKP